MVGRLLPFRPFTTTTSVSVRAVILAVVSAALLVGCGFLDQTADQDIFANVDLSTTEPVPPPADVEPQFRPALRVDVDEDGTASAIEPAEQTDGASGPIPLPAAARTAEATISGGTMTSAPTTQASSTADSATEPTSTTAAPITRATTTAAAPVAAQATITVARPTTALASTTSPGLHSTFPSSDVVRLSDGRTVTFQSQVSPGRIPVLAWLWAPG